MCDNKNELHQSEYDKSKDYTSTRLDLDITETTDSYPEFDFLDLLRNLQVKDKKVKQKSISEVSSNKSNLLEEDSEVEDLAKFYEEKYGTCNDYAELGEGYDEEDSFIDNSDAVNDLVPSGIQTEFGGFYINRGKLNFVKEDNSSSSTSEDADKFLAHNRLNTRRIISDDESEEKDTCKNQSNIQQSSTINSNIHSSFNNKINNFNINNSNNNNNNINSNNNNNNNNNNSNPSSNVSPYSNISNNIHNNVIKNKKRSKDYQHKSKKIRKTATPKIPDHLLYKKPFPGSLEYRKNINEFKKNRLKTIETDKKCTLLNSVVNSASNKDSDNNNSHNNVNAVNSSGSLNNNNNSNNSSNNKCNNSEEDIDTDKKEGAFAKKKPLTVKELLKERDGTHEECKILPIGQRDVSEKRPSSSSSESCESSSSDSDSYSSEDTPTEKDIIPQKIVEEAFPKSATINGSIAKDITAKPFAHLSDSLKELIVKVFEISKEEKNKFFNSKLNSLLLSLNDKLRELPMAERNAVLEHVAEILQMKKDNITKRIKKLLFIQEEEKMTTPLRKLKEAVANIMPLLESNYFNEYTKAAGTSPQIYAELSRYYWSIDPGSLPQRKFPWNEELRRYLREIVMYRKNCYYIIRPRKESLVDYIRSFMEAKVKNFWPEKWMTLDILLEEAQVATQRQTNDKQKTITKILGTQNSSNVGQKKTLPNAPASNRKQPITVPATSGAANQTPSRKPSQTGVKNPEVKSILLPRKTPQGSSSGMTPPKTNFPTSSLAAIQNANQGSRLQVTLNRLNVQEYLDRVSGSQTSISRNSQQQQISPNRSQQSVSPNRSVKTSPPNSVVLNSSGFRPNPSQKHTSPNSSNKSISTSVRNCNNPQSVLKTVGAPGNSVSSVKTSPNSVTISPVNELIFKDLSPSPEVLNLTKNSSVYISKVKDAGESRTCRSSSPSIGIPLPSGITISPTSAATPSTFLTKPPKQADKNVDVKINVSITKQDGGVNLAKEKRDALMNLNVKREGPLQNIPDCISVTSKVVPNERPKYEHVRKRALHEYQQQQHSPEKLKFEEKKLKTEENLLTDIEMKEDKLDEKNFSKIFDSVIETVRQSDSASSQIKVERFSNVGMDSGMSGGSPAVKNCPAGVSQFKNYPAKIKDVRSTPKEKTFFSGGGLEEKSYSDSDDRSRHTKEQRVQMEMDRVMQNLVELSREKNPDYELGYPPSPNSSSGLKPSSFQEPYQKILFK